MDYGTIVLMNAFVILPFFLVGSCSLRLRQSKSSFSAKASANMSSKASQRNRTRRKRASSAFKLSIATLPHTSLLRTSAAKPLSTTTAGNAITPADLALNNFIALTVLSVSSQLGLQLLSPHQIPRSLCFLKLLASCVDGATQTNNASRIFQFHLTSDFFGGAQYRGRVLNEGSNRLNS